MAATPFETNLRAVNDQRRALFGDTGRSIVFVCECRKRDCVSSAVLLTPEEYDARRPGPILVDGHDAD